MGKQLGIQKIFHLRITFRLQGTEKSRFFFFSSNQTSLSGASSFLIFTPTLACTHLSFTPSQKKGCKKIAEHNPEEENPQHTFFFLFALHHYSGTGGRFSTRTRFPADVFHTFSRNQLAGSSNPDYRRVVSDRAVQRKLRRPPVDEKRSEQNVEPSSSSSRT